MILLFVTKNLTPIYVSVNNMNSIEKQTLKTIAITFDAIRWDKTKSHEFKAWWLRNQVYKVLDPDHTPVFSHKEELFLKKLAAYINYFTSRKTEQGKPRGFTTCIACWTKSGHACIKISMSTCIEFPKITKRKFGDDYRFTMVSVYETLVEECTAKFLKFRKEKALLKYREGVKYSRHDQRNRRKEDSLPECKH